MIEVSSIRDLISLWPTRADLVSDLSGKGLDVSIHMVNKWAETNSIRSIYQQGVIDAAADRCLPVTAELIVRLHAPERHVA